jgi:HlyD family secretion protein
MAIAADGAGVPMAAWRAILSAHWRVIAPSVAIAVGILVLVWRFMAPPLVQVTQVVRSDVVQSVVVSGHVESPGRIDIGTSVAGTVVEIPVINGQAVHAGQLLVRLDESEPRAAVEQARFAVTESEARIEQLRKTSQPVAAETLRQAESNLTNAEKQLERQRELLARGFIGQAALDDAQRARDVAHSQWKAARLQLDSNSPGGSDHQMAIATLNQARAALKAAQARLALMAITAPVDGVLIARDIEKGDVAQPGKVLLTLSPAGATQVVADVDEKNLNLLQVGQPALASADAYPRERFDAVLAYINPGIDVARGSVQVKLDVPRPPPYLLQDMTVSIDIEVARRKGALTVPAESIHEPASLKPWVLVAKGNRAQRRDVVLGARGTSLVELASGVAEGDAVISSTLATIGDGSAVRIARKPRRPPRS